MNVLFITHKWQAKTGESCIKALMALGHRAEIAWAKIGAVSIPAIMFYKLKRSNIVGPPLSMIEMFFFNKLIVSKALKLKPDLIIVNAGGEVSPDTLQELRKKTNTMIVCWAGDDPNTYTAGPYYKAGVKYYHHYFLVDPSWYTQQLKDLGLRKCHILQYGVDPDIYKPLRLSEKERKMYGADLCHLGTLHKERKEILTQLLDYDLAIWGATSTRIFKDLSNLPKTLLPKVRGGIVPSHVSNKIYNASKICLNIQHSQVSFAHSNKTFEIAASGTFLLTSFCDANNMSFAKDEMICFKNVEELRYLIDYYLKNEGERNDIVRKAYQHTMSCHLYTHRLQQLLTECGF